MEKPRAMARGKDTSTAKEIAEARGKRAKTSCKGIPNAKTGACCAAKDFREATEEHENEKQGKTKAAVGKKSCSWQKDCEGSREGSC